MRNKRFYLAGISIGVLAGTLALMPSAAEAADYICCHSDWSGTPNPGYNKDNCDTKPYPNYPYSYVGGYIHNFTTYGTAYVDEYAGFSPGVRMKWACNGGGGETTNSTFYYPSRTEVCGNGFLYLQCQTQLADATYCSELCS